MRPIRIHCLNPNRQYPKNKLNYFLIEVNDTQTGVPLRKLRGAICVQRFDDSRNSAIHISYRISLRSSSLREPRDPLLKVVLGFLRIAWLGLSKNRKSDCS